MNALAQAVPDLVPKFADLWVRSMGIPKGDEIADRIKPPGVDEDDQDPAAMQAKVQQMQAAMQELQQLADDNQAKLKIAELKAQTDAAKAQQDGQVKQMAEQSKQQIAAQSEHTKLEIAGLQAQTAMAVAQLKAGQDEMKNVLQIVLKKMDLAHDTHMHAEAAAADMTGKVIDHEMGAHSSEQEHERAREMQDRTHEQSKEMQDRDQAHQFELAVTPPPEDPNKRVAE